MLMIVGLQESVPWREVMPEIILAVIPMLLPFFIGAVVCGIAGFMMLDNAERGGAGFALGFFLGPIGLVIAWVMRDNALREEESRRSRHHPIDDYLKNMKAPATSPNRATPARPTASHVASLTAIEELERLAALKERGHVTDEEFNRKKAQLLGNQPLAPQPRRFK
jgi:hypothetical protein